MLSRIFLHGLCEILADLLPRTIAVAQAFSIRQRFPVIEVLNHFLSDCLPLLYLQRRETTSVDKSTEIFFIEGPYDRIAQLTSDRQNK